MTLKARLKANIVNYMWTLLSVWRRCTLTFRTTSTSSIVRVYRVLQKTVLNMFAWPCYVTVLCKAFSWIYSG